MREKALSDVVLQLESARARLEVDLRSGGRLASLRVEGLELLVPREAESIRWGSFPMAPWAGRVRDGKFRFRGRDYTLPRGMPPHAIHGTTWTRPWSQTADDTIECRLGGDWPFAGFARQRFELADDELRLRLEVHSAGEEFPASCGWHPWFRRTLERGASVRIELQAGFMEQRDAAGIPDGIRIPPPPGPWDDCFGDLTEPPKLIWPGALELVLSSSCDYIVVYDQPEHAVCVEPQSGPPDALNREPLLVGPERPLIATSHWSWRPLRGEDSH